MEFKAALWLLLRSFQSYSSVDKIDLTSSMVNRRKQWSGAPSGSEQGRSSIEMTWPRCGRRAHDKILSWIFLALSSVASSSAAPTVGAWQRQPTDLLGLILNLSQALKLPSFLSHILFCLPSLIATAFFSTSSAERRQPLTHGADFYYLSPPPGLQRHPVCGLCPTLPVAGLRNSAGFSRMVSAHHHLARRPRSAKSTKLRELWRQITRERRSLPAPPPPLYDPHSYAQNFDDGMSTWEEPESVSRSFSARFAAPARVLQEFEDEAKMTNELVYDDDIEEEINEDIENMTSQRSIDDMEDSSYSLWRQRNL
ncbi:hypothetical protein ZIOFF_016248 [Zingiber officinale]|uniref:Uncharacterized protein n=1 Tax=Zingiber officinale TaxID=94328 RepID=A0A8J5HE53_ZINOF|nr:hypothetical protein ZIOFF_016248 [Zingiber officinale]